MKHETKMPKEIKQALQALEQAGFESYAVGGCVRDLLRGTEPSDWDITSKAKPEQIEVVFAESKWQTIYQNNFGTVALLTKSRKKSLKTIEITTFRTESRYTDKRHPDEIKWAQTLQEDLARMDFTVNAMAIGHGTWNMEHGTKKGKKNSKLQAPNLELIDLFQGQEDLKNKIIRAVGEPEKRFNEDALRMMRAVRFSVCLDKNVRWQIEEKTAQAIKQNSSGLKVIAQERIRDELLKIIASPLAAKGIESLRRLGLLAYILPELLEGFKVPQNKHHLFQVYQHNLLSLNYACSHNFSQEVRLACLLHDIGKPKTKQGQGKNATFHNHEIVGAKMAQRALRRLRFPKKKIDKIVKLVRYHLFYYNVDEVGPSSVRKLLRRVGQEDIEKLLQLRYADRIGSGVPKAEPYKLRHMKYLLEKVQQDPIKPTMLKLNGDEIMKILNVRPSPKVGQVLNILLSYVLSDPKNNSKSFLIEQTEKLGNLSDDDLTKLAQKAEKEINQIKTKKDEMTKAKYWVS